MQKINSVLNGINLKKLNETIGLIRKDPAMAIYKFRLNNQWVDGGYNQSVIKEFYGAGSEGHNREAPFILTNDEHEVLLGTDLAPNPVEYVLHALAGSLTTSLVYHAAARGYKVDSVKSTIEGELDLRGFLGIDNSIRTGYKEIRINFEIEGDFSDDKEKEEILKMASGYSAVFDMITNGVPVKLGLNKPVATLEVDFQNN